MIPEDALEEIKMSYEEARALSKELLAFIKQKYGHLPGAPLSAKLGAGILFAALHCDERQKAHKILDIIYNFHGVN